MFNNFPDDDNGRVLRKMQERVFPSQPSAEAFAGHFRGLGYTVSIEETGSVPDLPWDVTVKRTMIPTHADISGFEETLHDVAEPLGGRNDGWGSLIQPLGH
jgi:hypothetical protein